MSHLFQYLTPRKPYTKYYTIGPVQLGDDSDNIENRPEWWKRSEQCPD